MNPGQSRLKIFDRTTAGRVMEAVSVSIERDRIRFFAQVLGVTDPVHLDVSAARAAGFPDLVATPSFLMVVEALAEEARARAHLQSWYAFVNCDMRYLLHGGESYSYQQPIFAGDELRFETHVIDFQDKKGGALELCRMMLRVVHPERGMLVEGRRTLIHRLG